jgi:hypothetical protein
MVSSHLCFCELSKNEKFKSYTQVAFNMSVLKTTRK